MFDMVETLDEKTLQETTIRCKEQLQKHSDVSGRSVLLHLKLGKLYERAGEKESAIHEFAKVALYYADRGQMIKAMAAAQLIVRLDPENEEILDRLGDLYFMRSAVSDEKLEKYQESIGRIEALQQEADDVSTLLEEELQPEDIDLTNALRQVSLFARLSVSELRGVQSHSHLRSLEEDEPLFQNGNEARALFVILQGSVNIFGKNKEQQRVHLATLEQGALFGEFALFGKVDRRLSVIAEEVSKILEIPREIVLKLAKTRPQLTQALKELFKERILDTALAHVPLFSQMQPQDRRAVVTRFKALRVKQGATIIREGEPGDSMYFIASGNVGIFTSLMIPTEHDQDPLTEELLPLATLKSGDFFGEQALVTDEPRSATVIAKSDVSLLKLSKEDFSSVINEHPWIESALQIEAFQHRMDTNLSILNEIAPDL